MKILGIDIGISSIGWSLVETSETKEERNRGEGKIYGAGVRLFSQPVHPKTGKSLAEERRIKRGTRRSLRRKAGRMRAVKDLFLEYLPLQESDLFDDFNQSEDIYTIYKEPKRIDVWQLRHEGLHRKLTPKEFARVLTQIAKRRGYFSNAKEDHRPIDDIGESGVDGENDADKEKKQVLKALKENQQMLTDKGYETIGEMFYQEFRAERQKSNSLQSIKPIRNKEGKYTQSVGRELLREEVAKLFEKQRSYNSKTYPIEFEEKYQEIFFTQKPLKSVAHMVGYCEFEPTEKRSSKYTLSGEIFRAFSTAINATIIDPNGKNYHEREKKLLHFITGKDDAEKLLKVWELLCKQQKITYGTLRKEFNLPDEVKFKIVETKRLDTPYEKEEKKMVFNELVGYHTIRKALESVDSVSSGSKQKEENLESKELFTTLTTPTSDKKNKDGDDPYPLYNQLVVILTEEKEINQTTERIKKEVWDKLPKRLREKLAGQKDKIIAALAKIDFSGHLNLSLKAINKILPSIQNGLRYDEAVAKVYGHHSSRMLRNQKDTRTEYLPRLNKEENYQLTSPTVKRAVVQFRKLVNAIVRKYGVFDAMHVELAREIRHGKKERREIKKGQDLFKKNKDQAREDFISHFNREPSPRELLKVRLFNSQNGRSLYSNKAMDYERVIEEHKYTEIDHILPISRSLDDSLQNKALVLTIENQEKGNRTLFEWKGKGNSDSPEWAKFVGVVNSFVGIGSGKKNRLLNTNLPKRHGDELGEDDFTDKKDSWIARNLNDTRHISRFIKNYVENKLAFSENDNIKQKVKVRTGMLTANLRYLWGIKDKHRDEHYHHAVDAIILAFSTQSEVQRFSTTASMEAGYQHKSKEEKATIKRLKTTRPFLEEELEKALKNIVPSFAPRRKVSGAAHEETLYSAKDYRNRSKSEKGIVVKELTGSSRTYPVRLNQGRTLAKKDTMPRMDLFRHLKTKKYYSVPIYAADFVAKTLPNDAVSQRKNKLGEKIRIAMDEDYEFITSIYKNDFIEVFFKKEKTFNYVPNIKQKDIKENEEKKRSETGFSIRGYFKGLTSSIGTIEIESPFDKWSCFSLGIQSAKEIKKYEVTLLGEIIPIALPQRRVGTIHELRRYKKEQSK